MAEKILLFGAAGRTGREILIRALDAGHTVHAVEHSYPDDIGEHENCFRHTADLIEDDLDDLVSGVDCVISAVGLGRDPQTLACPPPLYTKGARNIVAAMRKTGVSRLVVTSAAFADRQSTVPLWFKAASAPLTRIFSQMAAMERILESTENIAWTAVRPGWLLERVHTGDYQVAIDDLPFGTLRTRRSDLADFILKCAVGERHVRAKPFIARSEEFLLESPPALIEEFAPW